MKRLTMKEQVLIRVIAYHLKREDNRLTAGFVGSELAVTVKMMIGIDKKEFRDFLADMVMEGALQVMLDVEDTLLLDDGVIAYLEKACKINKAGEMKPQDFSKMCQYIASGKMDFETKTQEVEKMGIVELTAKEQAVMMCILTDDFYEEGFESCLWVDCFCDNVKSRLGIGQKAAGGVITSLEKKGLVSVDGEKRTQDAGTGYTLKLLDSGKTYLASICISGESVLDTEGNFLGVMRQNLNTKLGNIKGLKAPKAKKPLIIEGTQLAEESIKPKVKTVPKSKKTAKKATPARVRLIAFTGMIIGEFDMVVTGDCYSITSNRNKELTFDKATLKQTNAKNARFGNRLEIL